jgi:uncharacterized protein YndB with AHSA1/START domain
VVVQLGEDLPMRLWGLSLITASLVGGVAHSAVVDATASGFQVEQKVEIAAPAAKVWAALAQFGDWWDSQHSWSGDAKNLHLDLVPGGYLTETLPHGGGVRHLAVAMVKPGELAVLDGELGPLMFSGASGHLVWALAEKDGHTTLTEDYYVGGYFKGGLDQLAGRVDGVLSDQMTRLKAYVETGKPTP